MYCRQIFETKLMIKRKTDEQEDIVDVVTGSKGVEYTPSKLRENKTRTWKSNRYKSIIFGNDTSICTRYFNDLKNKQIIDKRVQNQRLMENMIRKQAFNNIHKNTVVDADMMLDKKTGEVLGAEVDYVCCKCKF